MTDAKDTGVHQDLSRSCSVVWQWVILGRLHRADHQGGTLRPYFPEG
jgi:hypothetical protein